MVQGLQAQNAVKGSSNVRKGWYARNDKSIKLNGNVWGGYTRSKLNDYYPRQVSAIVFGANISYRFYHWLGVGLCFNGFENKFSAEWQGLHELTILNYLSGYYGGIFIEPVIFPKFPVHAAFPVTLGLGRFTNHYSEDYQDRETHSFKTINENCTVGVLEPGIELEINLFKYGRLGLGVKYRLTSGVNFDRMSWFTWKEIYQRKDLDDFTYHLSLKFGVF